MPGSRFIVETPCRWVTLALAALTVITAPSLAQRASATQDIKRIDTRPGVVVRVLPAAPAGPPRDALVMFPGSGGEDAFHRSAATVGLESNFLVRTTPEWTSRGFAVAIVDAPSDQARGMSDGFRTSPAHAQDIEKVIDYLAGKSFQPVFLVGTSRGTISVAYLGSVLRDPRIKGIVLTSTMGAHFMVPLALDHITLPVLIVHHRDDACRVTPFRDAAGLPRRLSRSSKVTFVEVRGGSAPHADPCAGLSAHGYLGMERPVVDVIARWASGGPVPQTVGPKRGGPPRVGALPQVRRFRAPEGSPGTPSPGRPA